MSETATSDTAVAPAGPPRLPAATVAQYVASRSALNDGERRVLLLRAAPAWDGPAVLRAPNGVRARVAAVPSVLGVHEQILLHLSGGGKAGPADPPVLVVLTDREDTELDPALLARTYGRRIREVDNWEVVRAAFGAQDIDARLRAEKWAAEALLGSAGRLDRAGLGRQVLSRDEALGLLARRILGLDEAAEAGLVEPSAAGERIDAVQLLRWTLLPGGPQRLAGARAAERRGIGRFLGEPDQAGSTGRCVAALCEAGNGADALAFAVVCAALWANGSGGEAVFRARGRAERFFGERPPGKGEELDELFAVFGRTGEGYVRSLLERGEHRLADPVLARAAQLTAQFGAESVAGASLVLQGGLDARFTAAGQALATQDHAQLTQVLGELSEHALAGETQALARVERVRMAARLRRWLSSSPSAEIPTVAAGIERQMAEFGWVDRALEHLEAGGDEDAVLAAAYDTVAREVRTRRQRLDHEFSERLAVWTAAGTPPKSLLTVETFLESVVAPITSTSVGRRVLLLVVDGMSAAIAAELGEELRRSWAEFDPLAGTAGESGPVRRAMAAALPTLTAVSRTSLFAGTLMKGDQGDEKRIFPQHRFWKNAPAAVFHKDDLRSEETGSPFSGALSAALADERGHVAVVLNTIDDRLAKEQKLGDGAWTVGEVGGLAPLLRAARASGMTVLITSDHGHVVDRHGERVEAGSGVIGSARHRTPGGPVAEYEVELSGPRVVWPEPDAAIVALRDHDSRYTARKAGYHGGATLAEVTIPVLALLPFGAEPPKGWREVSDPTPAWWHLDTEAEVREPAIPPAPSVSANNAKKPSRRRTQQPAEATLGLFDIDQVVVPESQPEPQTAPQPEQPAPSVGPASDLVRRLTASELYQAQIDLLARKPRGDAVPRALTALVEAGTLSMTALAERAGQPAARAAGFAATLAQLLNHDGAPILEILPDNRTLRLNRTLLRTQFEL
ncbi:BREX-2 system phosphatase PglZ [Kitasatospora sp. NPDC101235]|uniref:BREX-2 system phosphatase PglZ n=1 Tax=Kitasatospora sp. NPDC101235 TaxID=3364101 RepID=UPI0037F599FE